MSNTGGQQCSDESQRAASFALCHLATYALPLAGEVWPQCERDRPSGAAGENECDLRDRHTCLQLVPFVQRGVIEEPLVYSRRLSIGREVEVVRWRYPWLPNESSVQADDLRFSPVADASGPATDARQIARAVQHEKDNDPRLHRLASEKRPLGETTFVLALVCKDVQRQFAEDFFQMRFGPQRRALRVADEQFPEGVTIWKDGEKDCLLVLADPTAAESLQRMHTEILSGELDRVEVSWHLIRHTAKKYDEIVNGRKLNDEQDRAAKASDGGGFLFRLLRRLGLGASRRSQGSDGELGLFALRDLLGDRLGHLAEGKRCDQERLGDMYNKISRKETDATLLELEMRAFGINLEDETRQLVGGVAAVANCRAKDAKYPLNQIDLDLKTVRPQLDAARVFLASETEQHMGLLALFVVPLAMMQVVLAILQICWTVAHDTESQSWLHPIWGAFGQVAPALALVIIVALLPGIWYSLRFARNHHSMRSVGSFAVLIAVLVFLVFLVPLVTGVSHLVNWFLAAG